MWRMSIILCLRVASAAQAQTPPSAAEIAGYDGLHRAAQNGNIPAIRQLAAQGADVNARDASGRTPTHVAAFASNDDALIALAAAVADMNALEDGIYDVLTIAAVANDPRMVSLALDLGKRPDLITSVYDGTALIAAAHLGHHEVVHRLIEGGAPLDHVNNLGWTALIEAVILGEGGPDHVRTVQYLVEAGADLSIPDRDGVAALHTQRGAITRKLPKSSPPGASRPPVPLQPTSITKGLAELQIALVQGFAGRSQSGQNTGRRFHPARQSAGMQIKSGPDSPPAGSIKRLYHGSSAGPVHGFTLSTSGRDSLLVDDGRCRHSCPLPRWA